MARRRWRLELQAAVGFAAIGAILILMAVAWYRSTANLVADTEWVAHSHDVLRELEEVRGDLAETEATQRAYLVTGQPQYLARSDSGPQEILDHIESVQNVTEDNPAQQVRVATLRHVLIGRLAILHQTAELKRTGHGAAAAQAVAHGEGSRLSDSAQVLIASMQAEERRLLDARALEYESSKQSALTTAVTGGVLVLLVLLAIYRIGRREIRERRGTEREAQRARVAAEQAREAQAQFLANMSHEIRTPMNGVLGLTELLLDSELTPDQRRSLDLVRTSADALLTILNDILDFSKIESGGLILEHTAFDLRRLAESTAQMLAARAAERGVELVCDIGADTPQHVRGDPGRLRQILVNLIGNAIKFTPRGEVHVTVARDAAAAGRVQFTVRDTGIGIPADKIDAIFEEFRQADASTTREYGGTGLGLTITRRLVELMGGRIAVQSAVGRGSEFAFSIPLPPEETPPPPAAPAAPGTLAGTRVLVVDDNETNRRIVREMLAHAGLVVEEAPGVVAAVGVLDQARARGAPFALAIVDCQMPGRDGFDLAAMVRGDPAHAGTRLLMLTSMGQRGDAERCRALGIEAYLTKPVTRADLLDSVTTLLGAGGRERPSLVTRHTMAEARTRRRVLLAEDNTVNQEVAAAMLRQRGHAVTIVADGRAAVNAAARDAFDVVLMDIHMPELDGYAATAEIRASERGRTLPIIAVTANAFVGERERALAHGMSGYLAKPFRAHELYAAVEGPADLQPADPHPARVIDVEGFRAEMRAAGVEAAVDGILRTFLASASDRVAAISAAADAGDGAAIARAAHAYKSSAGTVGARGLAEQLAELEALARAGDIVDARARVPDLLAEHEAALDAVRVALS
ncbi:MAG TPA: response regulator [Gemmatimonadales bacterium]